MNIIQCVEQDTEQWKKYTPLSIATPRSSIFFFWLLTTAKDVFFCFLASGPCASCLVSKKASEGPRKRVTSAGKEKSVRKGMGWALATSWRSVKS